MKLPLLLALLWAFSANSQSLCNYTEFYGFTGVQLSLHYDITDTAVTTVTLAGSTQVDTCWNCGFDFPFKLPAWSYQLVVVTRDSITETLNIRVTEPGVKPD